MAGFSLYTDDGSMVFDAPFGAREPKPVGGGPVISRIVIPRRKSRTEWVNRDVLGMQLSFFLDDFVSGAGGEIERKCRMLERMWGQEQGDPEPPHLIVRGDPPGCVPNDYHDASHLRWWLEDIQWDDGTYRNSVGNRIRAGGAVILTEVSQDDALSAFGKAARSASGSKPRTYEVRPGDTLSKIATKYKIKGGWKALAKLNNIRDPRHLPVGKKIRLS